MLIDQAIQAIEDYPRAKFWSDELTKEIKDIAAEVYPYVPYWIDTGSDYNACMAMLRKFKEDLIEYKKPLWRKILGI